MATLDRLIRRKLSVWSILPTFICGALIFLFSIFYQLEELKRNNTLLAKSIALHIEMYMRESENVLHYLSEMPYSKRSRGEVAKYLPTIFQGFSQFQRVLLLDANGNIFFAYPNGKKGADFPRRLGLSHSGEISRSRPMICLEQKHLVIYESKVIAAGGTVVGELRLSALKSFVDALLEDRNEQIILTDSFGNVILHPQRSLIEQLGNVGDLPLLDPSYLGQSSAFYWYKNKRSFGSSLALEELGWKLVVAKPTKYIYWPVLQRSLRSGLLFVLFFSILLAFINRIMQRYVVVPMAKLSSNIDAISSGRQVKPSVSQHDFAELKTLENELLQMAKKVQDREQRLEIANGELHSLSIHDGLTQIPNRRHFNDILNKEWARAGRGNQSLSLIMCDIDYFKYYNDSFGHQAGDECLVKVAKTLQQSLHRSTDVVARYGGEEFALILPNTKQEGAESLARLIHDNIHLLQIDAPSHVPLPHLSLSIGVTTCEAPKGNLAEQLIKTADDALYQAKDAGRDRVVFKALKLQ